MSGDELPSAREAMRRAIAIAEHDYEGARLWLDIARELRAGETARPLPRPLDGRSQLAAEADLTTAGLMPIDQHVRHEDELRAYAGEQASPRFAPVHVPVEQPAYRDAETEVIRYDPSNDPGAVACAYCKYDIGLVFPEDGSPAQWRHLITRQRVCPVSDPSQGHSLATPAIDARG